jgi:hypothetical protein
MLACALIRVILHSLLQKLLVCMFRKCQKTAWLAVKLPALV